jgi:hypothetical protein
VNRIAWRTTMGASGAIMGKIEAAQTKERKAFEEKQAVEQKLDAVSQDAKQKLAAVEQEHVRATAGGEGAVMMRARGGAMAPTTPLEHKTIEGIQVEGRKTTTTIPAGKIGNELPLTIVSEEWRSPDLNILVLTHHSDPRSGDSSYRLTNIMRAEPDPSLFVVPSDYTVKDTGIKRMLEAARQPGR